MSLDSLKNDISYRFISLKILHSSVLFSQLFGCSMQSDVTAERHEKGNLFRGGGGGSVANNEDVSYIVLLTSYCYIDTAISSSQHGPTTDIHTDQLKTGPA